MGAFMRSLLPILAALCLLPACNREEEPVANRFERQKAEIENKAQALETQVENEVSATEARLDNEADTLLQNRSTPSPEANASEPDNRSR